ncbi:peroxide stress protein YaaA [Labilibacter marinus]|uniref:peroxide stress protein YaaA n=1 Tax=Labilibacter marinus TaxID=1477105 RepID=UPI00082AB715|nr:peroxide stress protein YaaA [Labilibacter marinus]
MQLIISPAKSLDFETSIPFQQSSDYRFTEEPKVLVDKLNTLSKEELSSLMKISDKLAELNFIRFKEWKYPFNQELGRQALFAFKGDVYTGLDAYSLDEGDVTYIQSKLRILSGLYGLLRPLDLILPYRLEMGSKLPVQKAKNLYQFWGDKITELLNSDIQDNKHKVIINLASSEYFKSINKKRLKVPIITPEFRDLKNGEYKMISFYAKKARGLMTRFIVKNRIQDPEEIKAFDLDGYYYNNQLSKKSTPVFTRDH